MTAKIKARGMCRRHYEQWREARGPATLETRFWEYVDKDGPIPPRAPHLGPCWICTRVLTRGGYAGIMLAKKNLLAHRVSYVLHVGPVPEGLQVDHLCFVRNCVNPAHLEAVTPRENVLRGAGLTARNAVKTHCPRGHAYDEANTYRDTKGRQCRACSRIRDIRRRELKRAERIAA